MTDAPTAPAIFEALVRIQSELGKIEKDGRGPSSQGAYPFMRVDTIVARLGPLLSQHGVVVIGNQTEAEQQTYRFPKVNMDQQPVFDGKPDAFQIITRLRYEFTFIASEDGSSVTAAAYGESADTGDKGLRRAATAAYKEVLLRVFTITSGEDDPDSLDPNDQPAAVSRQDRGAQAREKAARGKTERAPRASRAPREDAAVAEEASAAAESPTEETPAAAAATASDDSLDTSQQEDEQAAAPTQAERRAAAAAARQKPAAKAEPVSDRTEGGREGFEVDPADVAHAESQAPQAREPQAPVEKPEPETKADQRYESVADVRKAIRDALAARSLERDYVNTLGDEITGKPRGQWFANLLDLHKVLKAIENGEVAANDEPGF